jgi:hypothetical protein
MSAHRTRSYGKCAMRHAADSRRAQSITGIWRQKLAWG